MNEKGSLVILNIEADRTLWHLSIYMLWRPSITKTSKTDRSVLIQVTTSFKHCPQGEHTDYNCNTAQSRSHFHNHLIRLKSNQTYLIQNYTYFRQIYQEC